MASLFLVSCASGDKKSQSDTSPSAAAEEVKPTASTLAGPNQTLWKAECRKIVNEAGKEVDLGSPARIQSSYLFDKASVVWNVINHMNAQCKGELSSGDRYTFKCDGDVTKKNARCTQIKVESFDKIGWRDAKMTDDSGHSDILVMEYRMTSNQPDNAKLRSRSISDQGEWTLEHLTSE